MTSGQLKIEWAAQFMPVLAGVSVGTLSNAGPLSGIGSVPIQTFSLDHDSEQETRHEQQSKCGEKAKFETSRRRGFSSHGFLYLFQL
jgi:hypothetical protein